MEQNTSTSGNTLAENIFQRLVRQLGAPIVKQVFAMAEETWKSGGEGVTYPSEADDAVLSLYDDNAVNFRLGDWGPCALPLDRAYEIMNEVSDEGSE